MIVSCGFVGARFLPSRTTRKISADLYLPLVELLTSVLGGKSGFAAPRVRVGRLDSPLWPPWRLPFARPL